MVGAAVGGVGAAGLAFALILFGAMMFGEAGFLILFGLGGLALPIGLSGLFVGAYAGKTLVDTNAGARAKKWATIYLAVTLLAAVAFIYFLATDPLF